MTPEEHAEKFIGQDDNGELRIAGILFTTGKPGSTASYLRRQLAELIRMAVEEAKEKVGVQDQS